jgi:hypothetical protein
MLDDTVVRWAGLLIAGGFAEKADIGQPVVPELSPAR